MKQKLTSSDHSREIAGLKYLYPVISRRSGGLSIGINVNTNNACNWGCVYCQVPDLTVGAAPELDFKLLEQEFRLLLSSVLSGAFFEHFEVLEHQRVIKDIAISGNGEPTSLQGFDQLIRLLGEVATEMQVLPGCDFVLISNGSLMHKAEVQRGLRYLNSYGGQVWFKLDSATEAGRATINKTRQSDAKTGANLATSISLCETRLQTCLLDYLPDAFAQQELTAYVQMLADIKQQHPGLSKVMLYSIARPSRQPEADSVHRMDIDKMQHLAHCLQQMGYEVSVSD